MPTITIKSRYNDAVLYSCEALSLREAVAAAVKDRAYLGGAYLGGADLRGAYLGSVKLKGADLRGADLRSADLGGADLRGAYLGGADLRGVKLKDAEIIGRDAVVQIGPIGSRGDTFTVFRTDKGLRLQTGCFYGDADDFLARLMEAHGTNQHATNYRNALELAASMLEVEHD